MSALQAARIMELRAVLARIAHGQPASTLEPGALRSHLELAQRAAYVALEDDDKEAAREGR